MAHIKDVTIGSNTYLIEPRIYAITSGTTSAFTASIDNFELVTGVIVTLKMNAANEANATLKVGTTDTKNIQYKNTNITAGALKANRFYSFIYDGTNWQLIGELDTNNVTQTLTTANNNYPVLFAGTANSSTSTEGVRKHSGLIYNPSTSTLTATNFNGTATKINITASAPTTSSIIGYLAISSGGTSGSRNLLAQQSLYIYDNIDANQKITGVYLNIGQSNNTSGGITLWSARSSYYGNIVPPADINDSNKTWTLPDVSGTIALTNSNITGTAANVTGIVAVTNGGTGSSSTLAAANNLGLMYWGSEGGTNLTSGDDLNSFIDSNIGNYRSATSATSKTLLNAPFNAAGFKFSVLRGYLERYTIQMAWGTSVTPWLRIQNGETNTDGTPKATWSHNDINAGWAKVVYARLTKTINSNSYDTFSSLGNSTQPVYVSSDGAITACTSYADASVASADKLTGLNGRSTIMAWGNQTGTVITCFNSAGGGGWGFRDNNPASGQMSMTIDGTIYIKEGAQDISNAVKSFSVSGQTVTYTNLWGNSGTFTTQDTKNTAGSTNSTSKLFLIGATSQSTNLTTNSYQYTYTNNGLLSSTKLGLNASGTEKFRMEWNSTDLSVDFIFA